MIRRKGGIGTAHGMELDYREFAAPDAFNAIEEAVAVDGGIGIEEPRAGGASSHGG